MLFFLARIFVSPSPPRYTEHRFCPLSPSFNTTVPQSPARQGGQSLPNLGLIKHEVKNARHPRGFLSAGIHIQKTEKYLDQNINKLIFRRPLAIHSCVLHLLSPLIPLTAIFTTSAAAVASRRIWPKQCIHSLCQEDVQGVEIYLLPVSLRM